MTAASTAASATGMSTPVGGAPVSAPPVPSKSSGFGFSKLSGLVDRARGAPAPVAGAAPAVEGPPSATEQGANGAPEVMDDHEGDLSLDVAERMLRWHAEAIGRCVDLSSSSDV